MKRILLDNNLDHRFARLRRGIRWFTAAPWVWRALKNGELVLAAEREGFEVLVTGDKNLRYQQNLARRRLSIVTLNSRFITLQDIAPLAPLVLQTLNGLEEGSFVVIDEE